MASHKADASKESNKKAEDTDSRNTEVPLKGDFSEILEQVEEMYKAFLVVPPKDVSKESESKKTQPWRSKRVDLEKERGNSGSSKSGEGSPRSPRQQASRPSIFSTLKFQVPRFGIPDIKPEWQEIDNLVKCLRKILKRPMYQSGDRLSLEDEMKVRSVFQYHPKVEEKTGPGIDYIKIKEIIDSVTRCFWVVRTDGTEVDFSFHKCLKAKVAKEVPDLLEHYESLYMNFRKLDMDRAQRQDGDKL